MQFIGVFHGFKFLFDYALRKASPWGEAVAERLMRGCETKHFTPHPSHTAQAVQ